MVDEWRGYLQQQLISLPGKRHFRFIDFRSCPSEVEHPIVDTYPSALETVLTIWKNVCKC